MKQIHRMGRLIGRFSDHLIGWLLLLSVVLNVTQVFTRYALNAPLFWTEEMVRYTTVWLTFAGAAAASLYGDHMDMNLFLGVRNLNEGFLPAHLKYLQTYFTRRPMNRLFPVSVIASTVVAALIWQEAGVLGIDSFDANGWMGAKDPKGGFSDCMVIMQMQSALRRKTAQPYCTHQAPPAIPKAWCTPTTRC